MKNVTKRGKSKKATNNNIKKKPRRRLTATSARPRYARDTPPLQGAIRSSARQPDGAQPRIDVGCQAVSRPSAARQPRAQPRCQPRRRVVASPADASRGGRRTEPRRVSAPRARPDDVEPRSDRRLQTGPREKRQDNRPTSD